MSTDHANEIIEQLLALSNQGRIQFVFPSTEPRVPCTTEVSFTGEAQDTEALKQVINSDTRMEGVIRVDCIVPSNVRPVYLVSAAVLAPTVA